MIYVIAMNIFSISWENLRVILLLPWRRKYFINAFYIHLVEKMQQFVLLSWSKKWQRDSEKCVSFHKTEQDKMIIFVSLHTKALHFHEVEKYLVICVTSTKWKVIQKETEISIKVEIIVIFLFPQNRKCYTSKFCFYKMEWYFMIHITSKEWKILDIEI